MGGGGGGGCGGQLPRVCDDDGVVVIKDSPAITNIVPSDCSLAGLFSSGGKSGLSRSS